MGDTDTDTDATESGTGSAAASNTGPGPTGTPTTSGTTSTGTGTGPDATETGGDTEDPPGDCVEDDAATRFLWVANSAENTVSKIDAATAVEVARYASGPPDQAEPSRIAVSLYGDVAVSNRGAVGVGPGGVTKIAARLDDCVDSNGERGIQTSDGANDVLPWGEDECVLFNVPIGSTGYERGPRPTVWEPTVDDDGCAVPSPSLWVGWFSDADVGRFERLDGVDGSQTGMVSVPSFNGLAFGPYTGVIDADGSLWALGWQLGPLVRIDTEMLEAEVIPVPPPNTADMPWAYGLSIDGSGDLWITSSGAVGRYQPTDDSWTWVSTTNMSQRGLAVDTNGLVWSAIDLANGVDGCGLSLVDGGSVSLIEAHIEIPGCITPVGVSIDAEGFVWVVDQGANAAFKVDPRSRELVAEVLGLAGPYSYSDMTGHSLRLAVGR